MNATDLKLPAPAAPSLLSAARDSGVLIFGTGSFARDVAAALDQWGVPVRAWVVSRPTVSSLNGVLVHALDQVPEAWRTLPLCLGVFNREVHSDLLDLARACRAAGFGDVRFPQDFIAELAPVLGWRYWLAPAVAYLDEADALRATFAALDDAESRAHFQRTLDFRLRPATLEALGPSPEPQYFTAFMRQAAGPAVFYVDGGAYDGDTLAEAGQWLPLTGAAVFEPDPANFARLVTRASSLPWPTQAWPCGLSDHTGLVGFTQGQGEAAAVSETADSVIPVLRLDDALINRPVDFLKLDIEGHELAALTGARQTLLRHRPRLAIAGYHRPDDLWKIPQFIKGLDLDYRLAYRMHGRNTFDCVFYAY